MIAQRLATVEADTDDTMLVVTEVEKRGLLLVNDSRSWADLRRALQQEGYHVWAVAHGPGVASLYRLCKGFLRAVVIDLDADDPRGLETLRTLTALDPDVECIVMSSEADAATLTDVGEAIHLLSRTERVREAARDIKQLLTD